MTGGAAGRRRVTLWVAAIVVLAAVAAGLIGFLRKGTSELPVYTTAGARMLAGEEIFRPEDLKPFTYPPFFAVPFVPFVWLPEAAHRVVWYFVNLGALAWIAVLLRRLARTWKPPSRREAWLWVVAAALAARHVAAVFQNQSHDLLVFLMVMLGVDAIRRHGELRGGGWCGLAASCKATPLLFLPTFLGQLRLRAALSLVLVAAAATSLPDLLFPRLDGAMWVQAWADTFLGAAQVGRPAEGSGAWSAVSFLNQNLAGTILRLSTHPGETTEFVRDVAIWAPSQGVLRAVTTAAQLLVVAVIALAAWPRRSRGLSGPELGWRRVGEAALVVCGMVLLSPMSSKSHFCVLALPAVYCSVEVLWRRRRASTVAFLVVAFALGTLTSKGVLGRELGSDVLAMGAVTWSAVAFLFATATTLLGSSSASEQPLADLAAAASNHSL